MTQSKEPATNLEVCNLGYGKSRTSSEQSFCPARTPIYHSGSAGVRKQPERSRVKDDNRRHE
jgi:hypothetical protein